MSSMLSQKLRSLLSFSALIVPAAAYGALVDVASAPPIAPPTPTATTSRTPDPIDGVIAQWNMIRRTENLPFSSYAVFLMNHRDWPGEAQLRRVAERALRPGSDAPDTVIGFFRLYPPQSPASWLRYAEALHARGFKEEARQAVKSAWTTGALPPDEETRLISRFGEFLNPADHDARMDRLLWLRATAAAARQMALTSPARREGFEVRLALLTKTEDAPDRLAYATAKLRADPGFIADYMWWLRNTGQNGVARQILRQNMEMSHYPPAADVWLQMLLISAQEAAKAGDWQIAYDIARRAHSAYPLGTALRDQPFAERDAFTDLTWLAGSTALNKLDQPSNAANMFRLYASAARSPQTQARGWYWAGRAYLAASRPQEARQAFEQAARFVDQFHGQLALERLGRKPKIDTQSDLTTVSATARAAFSKRSVVRAMLSLGRAGNWQEQSLFVRSIANSVASDEDHILAAEIARQAGRPDLNVLVGRNARNSGLSGYIKTAFPQIEIPDDLRESWAIIHAISRQESQFDRLATSRVGAKGLMQLMPATARETAQRAGIPHDPARLGEPSYNVSLGARYFRQLLERYSGSYVLAVAAYNAGPGNVNRWIRTMGDPRNGADVLDWIESIPFSETRNYVQRVLENAVVYDTLQPDRALIKSDTPLSAYLGKRSPG